MRIDEKFDLDKLFFTSDSHFFHDNIIKYCNRPFSNAIEMNEALISNWNSVVPEDGNVFMAGDFIHTGKIESVQNIVDKLNGRIWWILGNHCYQSRHDRKVVSDIVQGRQMDAATVLIKNDNDQRLFISHYPHLYWPRDTWHLHGHIHSGPNSTSSEKAPFHPLRLDVGVDNCEYKPISYQQVKDIINKQKEL